MPLVKVLNLSTNFKGFIAVMDEKQWAWVDARAMRHLQFTTVSNDKRPKPGHDIDDFTQAQPVAVEFGT